MSKDKDKAMPKKTKTKRARSLTFEQCGQIVTGNVVHHDELFIATLDEEIGD